MELVSAKAVELEEPGSQWASLTNVILERVGCELPLRDILSARLVCRQWRQHVGSMVTHLPHAHQPGQRDLAELDAQPQQRGHVWDAALAGLTTCLPRLSEVVVYAGSRVSFAVLGAQLLSLPARLPGLTKLELRFLKPDGSNAVLGESLQQLQPALSSLTGLRTLYLIKGDSPEASQFPRVLPPLTGLRDLKLLSRLGSYGLGAEELEALAAAACPQLQRLQVELCPDGEEFGPRGAEEVLRAMTRLRGLRCLQLDFTAISLGAEVVEALRELRELQELSLVVNDPEHLADLFSLPALERLSLHYQSFDIPAPYDLGPPPPPPRLHEDDEDEWDSEDDEDSEDEGPEQTDTVTCLTLAMSMLAQLVRGTAKRPVLLSLDVSCCVVNADLLARLALLTSLTSLSMEECRWTRVPDQSGADYIDAAAIRQRRTRPWIVLTSLTRLTSLHLQINGAPPIPESDVTALAAALTGLRSLKVFNPMHRDWQPRLPPVNFNAYVSNWRQLESLVLCSPFPYDPRVMLDAALLPPSLTNLGLAHLTLTRGSSSCCATAATSEAAGDKSSSSFEAPAMMPGAGTTEQQQHHHHHQQHQQAAAFPPDSSSDAPSGPASSLPALPALESLALKCVRLGSGVSLGALLGAAPGLRSLGVRNPLPRLTDSCCAAFSALTALTTLRVEQAASAYDAMMQAEAGAPACEQRQDSGEEQQQEGADEREGAADGASLEGTGSEGSYYDGEWLSGAGLTALTGLRNLRQLQWLPYAGEQVRPEQVEVLSSLQRLQLLTLPSYDVNDDMGRVVLETVREKMPLCDVIKFRRGFSMEGEDVDEETEEGSSA